MGDTILLALLIYLTAAILVRIEEHHRWRTSLTAFRLQLPAEVDTTQAGRWIGTLTGITGSPWWPLSIPRWWPLGIPHWPLALELVASHHGIQHVLIIPDHMTGHVLASLTAVIPGARAEELPNYLVGRLSGWQTATELRLTGQRHFLDTRRAEHTARHVLASLQPVNSGEQIRLQWIITGARPSWRARHDDQRKDQEHPPTATILRWRTAHPILSATCRITTTSHNNQNRNRARGLLAGVLAAIRGMNTLGGYIACRRWCPDWWTARCAYRWALPLVRWPFTLTSPELGALLGLVSSHDLPGLPAASTRTLPPAPATPTAGLVIASSNHPSSRRLLCLQQEDRLRHLWIIGPTGVGKSTLLANLISYDIHRGYGVIAIDARGDLITDVLARVPDNRADDVIVVDPTDSEHPVGFNPLANPHPELAAGFVLHVLHSIYADSWGPRTADVLRASLLTLTHATPASGRYTLCELPELLTNPGFRRSITRQSLPAGVGEFWRWYEALSDRERLHVIAPVLNKLRAFTLSTPLRLLLGQSEGLDFTDVFIHRRIVLVPLKKGLLGAETASLIGSLLVAAVWQATLSRATIPTQQRHPMWLYVDEFQDIVRLPIDLADMLAQARGLGLGLTLAHQYLSQLSPEIKAAVLGTARSQLVFQLEYEDAKQLAPRFAPLTVHDLTGLRAFDIALRPCIGGTTLGPVTGHTYPLPPPTRNPDHLAEASRSRYGQPRPVIEANLTARSHTPTTTTGAHPNRVPLHQDNPHDPHDPRNPN